MEKIRILHILDELNTGGAERIVFSYFQNIDRSKFQWDFVITRYEDPTKRGLLEKNVEEMGGKIYRVHRKRENYIANIKDVDNIIKDGHYDIVHSHLDELSAFYLASAKKYKVPVRICHSHLAGAERGKGVELICKLIKPLLNYSVTDRFACGNDAAIALWGEKTFKRGQVSIVHNAINTEKFKFSQEIRNQVRSKLDIQENVKALGFVGRLSYQKNPEYVIAVFNAYHQLNPDAVLLMIGDGEKFWELQNQTKKYGLSGSVRFLGRRDDINELMMGMDLFLLPSRYEGLPIVMVEAQCSGLACLVSSSITREIKIQDNVKYKSLGDGCSSWASEAEKLLSEATNRSESYKSIINAGYNISTEANKLEHKYIELIRNKGISK